MTSLSTSVMSTTAGKYSSQESPTADYSLYSSFKTADQFSTAIGKNMKTFASTAKEGLCSKSKTVKFRRTAATASLQKDIQTFISEAYCHHLGGQAFKISLFPCLRKHYHLDIIFGFEATLNHHLNILSIKLLK